MGPHLSYHIGSEQNSSLWGRGQRFKMTSCSVEKKKLLCFPVSKESPFEYVLELEGINKTPSVNRRALCVVAPKVNSGPR